MGLRKPQSWYSRIENYLHSLGLLKSEDDPNLYLKGVMNKPLIFILYVDEFFLIVEKHLIAWCKRELTFEFEMKDLGLMYYSLGLKILQMKMRFSSWKESTQLMCCAS